MASFDKQVAVVTGAAGNLGQATAQALLASGAQVVAVDRSAERATKIFAERGVLPEGLYIEASDATDVAAVEAMMARVNDRFGHINALVNTVGAFRGGKSVLDDDLGTWTSLFEINVMSALVSMRAALPHMMRQRRGFIVNVASRSALTGSAGAAAYSASKAALLRLTESLAEEVRAFGIHVNAVLPGTIDTPQNRAAMPDAKFETWVTPEAVADAIVFMTSDAARALYGAAIPVSGSST